MSPVKVVRSLTIVLLAFAAQCYSEVTLVREYASKPPRDKRILFRMLLTPEQDVLSFIASDTKDWRLSRVRNWVDKQPVEENLTIAGMGRKEGEQWYGWDAKLLISTDGKLAICIASAWRRLTREDRIFEDVITVVDLAQFKVVSSLRPSSLPQLAGNFRLYNLNIKDQFAVHAVRTVKFDGGWEDTHKISLLELPSLNIGQTCEYSERKWASVTKETEVNTQAKDSCAGLTEAGADSTTELDRLERGRQPPPDCRMLNYHSIVSRDGKFRRELCVSGYENFFGNYVVTNATETVFSLKTGAKLGVIKWPKSHPLQSRFVRVGDQQYLLTMEGGTLLRVYHVAE